MFSVIIIVLNIQNEYDSNRMTPNVYVHCSVVDNSLQKRPGDIANIRYSL